MFNGKTMFVAGASSKMGLGIALTRSTQSASAVQGGLGEKTAMNITGFI
jgi:NAD(P)-dependent dehydrogenase (short-subunit alcohol dehydrogenase family)